MKLDNISLTSILILSIALFSISKSAKFINGPKYTVAFLEIYSDLARYNQSLWDRELDAMLNVDIRKIVIQYVLSPYYPNYTNWIDSNNDNISPSTCKSGPLWKKCNTAPNMGCYASYYPSKLGPCVYEAYPGVNAIELLLNSALSRNVSVWMGLALPYGGNSIEGELKNFARLQMDVLAEIQLIYGAKYAKVLKGWYPVVEVANVPKWLSYNVQLATLYYEPISVLAKKFNQNYQVFGSPFFRINATYLSPDEWRQFWIVVFNNAPHFDFIALQDGAGGGGYNWIQIQPYFQATVDASRQTNRTVWSNNEIWRHYGPPKPASCDTRRPAPTEIDISFLAHEAPLVDEMIFWEWHSYLSPYALCPWKQQAVDNYNNYLAYVTGGDVEIPKA